MGCRRPLPVEGWFLRRTSGVDDRVGEIAVVSDWQHVWWSHQSKPPRRFESQRDNTVHLITVFPSALGDDSLDGALTDDSNPCRPCAMCCTIACVAYIACKGSAIPSGIGYQVAQCAAAVLTVGLLVRAFYGSATFGMRMRTPYQRRLYEYTEYRVYR